MSCISGPVGWSDSTLVGSQISSRGTRGGTRSSRCRQWAETPLFMASSPTSAIYGQPGERVGHTLVLGTTRVGKTRLCELLVTQDIRRGDVVIVFDPKGDVELLLECMRKHAARAARRTSTFSTSDIRMPRPDIHQLRLSRVLRKSQRGSPVSYRPRASRCVQRVRLALHQRDGARDGGAGDEAQL